MIELEEVFDGFNALRKRGAPALVVALVVALIAIGGITYWYFDIIRSTEPQDPKVMHADAAQLRVQLAIERTRLEEARASQSWMRNVTRDSREVRQIEARAEALQERLFAQYHDIRQVEAGSNPAREAALQKMWDQIGYGLIGLGFIGIVVIFLKFH